MTWKARNTMSLKEEFLERFLNKKKRISSLCQEFEISRKTAYKWIGRFREDGVLGLNNLSRRPLSSPTRVSEEIINIVLEARNQFPAWGARKLRHYLLNKGFHGLPCEATFNRILLRKGRIDPKESEKREPWIRFERGTSNELWQMDFKGHFKLCNEGRCHPLTILDDHSRFSISLKACAGEDGKSVRKGLEEAFYQYGLPEEMTMDNGSPWKGHEYRLSRITVWLMRLGIKVSHSAPYHPQTQGKLERFHRSLKEEVLKFHQFEDLDEAQTRFDEWRELYNTIRPHEGIGLECPKSRYQASPRGYSGKLPDIEYGLDDIKIKVKQCGTVYFRGKDYWVGEHLAGEYVGARQVKDNVFDIYFSKTKVQRLNLKK